MGQLEITYERLEALRIRERNPRLHSKRQIGQIAASIREFGFTNPLLVDESGTLIAGHGRREAARLCGLEVVPVIRLSGLTETQKRALVIADNKLAMNSKFDEKLLVEEIEALVGLQFDVEVTGFDVAEIDVLLADEGLATSDAADECPDLQESAVSRPGDLWRLGRHRLICGDALQPETYRRLLGEEKAELVFTDPPYNVRIDGHASGLGRIRHREFAMASGEMSNSEFATFLRMVAERLVEFSRDGSISFICMDWRGLLPLLTAATPLYTELKNLCVWAKTNAGMGSLYRSQHEFVAVLKNGTAPHINNVELGRKGRFRTNVWRYPGMNTFGRGRDQAHRDHPTVKPVALVADAIKDCSSQNGLVLDPFGGSGTTIIACEKTRRRGAAIEIDPLYVDVAIRRFKKLTGVAAIHAETGETFEAVQTLRSVPVEERHG